MKINTENIEQWMFDFHEGMLSEPDKAELLNFLHTHPELNAEFGLWAQTHALKNEQVAVPANLLDGILKPVTIPFYLNKFILGTITGLTFSALIVAYFLTRPSIEKSKTHTVPQLKMPLIIKNEGKKETATIKPNKIPDLNISTKLVELRINHSQDEKPGILQSDTAIKTASGIEMKEELPSIILTKPDSIIAVSEPTTTEKPLAEKPEEKPVISAKKKKNRLPLNVKPQSQFKPANSNF